ncbi:hypothetical protein [Mesorhizobium sp. IMUNJ 23232]|uniref:hypothetical protein n=1 Tax=Mesorhizobium sp. IMUNJ 23232 TaxID=3376064 RepID=UPI0037879978
MVKIHRPIEDRDPDALVASAPLRGVVTTDSSGPPHFFTPGHTETLQPAIA